MPNSIPNREIVVYALFLLGGEYKRIHTEDIALKCFELHPESFSWTIHTKYPDKDIVRVALTDSRKAKHGALVEGRAGQRTGQASKTDRKPVLDGWTLTEPGIAWIKANIEQLESKADAHESKEHRQKMLQQLRRVKEQPLFERFKELPERFAPSIGEIAEVLRCRVDAEPRVWEKRLESIRRKAQATDQEEVLAFIEKCERAYEVQR